MTSPLRNKSILLIITGSIAAYKCADLVRRLLEKGAQVKCVMTTSAQAFITPLLMASLSQQEVYTDLWSLKNETEMGHIRLSREADLILVAPASANSLAKLAHGLCDDLSSTILMATDKPVAVAPAMNPMMWLHPATQANVALLRQRDIDILSPADGDMACGETGIGRMMDIPDIIQHLENLFSHLAQQQNMPLKGRRALITSGPTYEAIDPVRFIGNFSSGKQGHAIATALARAGAETTLITGPTQEPLPTGIAVKHVISADEMLQATLKSLPADIVICAAAVADWKPSTRSKEKIKKGPKNPQITLIENQDILKTISQRAKKRPQLVIGFAAETSNLRERARKKLVSKKCDWILANDVSPETGTFGSNLNTILLLQSKKGRIVETLWPQMSKQAVAEKLVAEIVLSLKTDLS